MFDAPYNTQLPVSPKFKADLSARYSYVTPVGKGFVQLAGVYVGARTADLRVVPQSILGTEPAYTQFDLSTGFDWGNVHLELYVNNVADTRGQLDRYAECDATKCGAEAVYIVPTQPRTIGVKFGQKF